MLLEGKFFYQRQGYYKNLLLSEILKLKSQGLNTGQISRVLTSKGYLSVQGKDLLSKHVWSMIRKNKRKLESYKEYKKELRNIRVVIENNYDQTIIDLH